MAREHETSVQPWGTLEELLLACAVNRHGTKSWDSIAMEVQNRSSTDASAFLTPQNCRDKFDDLKRRFMSQNDDESASLLPMVDELKKIRVEDLRREVRRRDVSIVSLELKVKRLEEERERSVKEAEAELRVDLPKNLEGDGIARKTSSENHDGKSNSGVGSDSYDRENRSYNESNSTSQKRDFQRNGVVSEQAGPETDRNESDPARTESEPGRGGKATGKVVDDDDNDIAVREDNTKQSSDVQSSMSLSRRKRRRRGGGGAAAAGSSSGEEPEGDEVSPATKRVSALKSEPLVKLLGTIRSHRLGSVFQRRLRSQESQRYKNLIRQHLDLQAIEARLEKGVYLGCFNKFFRDLLLLFNNAIVFFRKSSPEYVAAQELRTLVLKEMKNNNKLRKTQTLTAKPEPKQEADVPPKPPNKTSIIVTCGKRSSSKAVLSEGINRKGSDNNNNNNNKDRGAEEKQKGNEKKISSNGSFVSIDEKGIRKKRSQERMGRRGLRTGNKGGGENEHEFGGNELSSHDALEVKTDKKDSAKKKQGVVSFLKRMKQNSPKEAKEELNSSEDDSEEDSKTEKEEDKKRKGRKIVVSDGRRERITRNSTRGRVTREEGRKAAKRGVGRPPKRPEKAAASGKRGRDNVEAEVGVGGRPKKRSRR